MYVVDSCYIYDIDSQLIANTTYFEEELLGSKNYAVLSSPASNWSNTIIYNDKTAGSAYVYDWKGHRKGRYNGLYGNYVDQYLITGGHAKYDPYFGIINLITKAGYRDSGEKRSSLQDISPNQKYIILYHSERNRSYLYDEYYPPFSISICLLITLPPL